MVLAIILIRICLLRPVTFAQGLWPILTLIDVNHNRTAFLLGLAAVIRICLASRLPERQTKRWVAALGILGYLLCLAT